MSNFFSYQFVYERNKELKIHNNQNGKKDFFTNDESGIPVYKNLYECCIREWI